MDLLEILAYPEQRSRRGEPQFESEYTGLLGRFSRKYFRYRFLFVVLSALLHRLHKRKSVDIVFLGLPFLHLTLQTSAHFKIMCLLQDENELFSAIRHHIPGILAWKWKAELFQAYKTDNTSERREHLDNIVTEIKEFLSEYSPRAIVLKNDSFFLERAVIFAARSVGIQTITIQHGLFMRSTEPHVFDGYWTDHMFVWSEYFKDLYRTLKILPEESVHILGFPYPVDVNSDKSVNDPSEVCLLGQPWELYADRFRITKVQIISNVMEACARLDIGMVYRPHPSESRLELAEHVPDLSLTKESESLQEAIDRYGLFCSMTSTALVEVVLKGRNAVQIRADDIPADNFEDIGLCYSVDNDPDEIEELLRGLKQSTIPFFEVNHSYIHVAENLGEKFVSIIDKVTGVRHGN